MSLTLAGVLPDGTLASGGAAVLPDELPWGDVGGWLATVVTGLRQATTQLYLRIDGRRSVWVSQPEGSDQSIGSTGVVLQGMTPDGHNVFFVTDSALLDSDINGGPDLYRYTDSPDPANDEKPHDDLSERRYASNDNVGSPSLASATTVSASTTTRPAIIWCSGMTAYASR